MNEITIRDMMRKRVVGCGMADIDGATENHLDQGHQSLGTSTNSSGCLLIVNYQPTWIQTPIQYYS